MADARVRASTRLRDAPHPIPTSRSPPLAATLSVSLSSVLSVSGGGTAFSPALPPRLRGRRTRPDARCRCGRRHLHTDPSLAVCLPGAASSQARPASRFGGSDAAGLVPPPYISVRIEVVSQRWLEKEAMFHRSIFLYMAWILRRIVLLWWRTMLHATSLAGILHNGLQASVLVLMIHRAVVLVQLVPASYLEKMHNSWDLELLLDHALHIACFGACLQVSVVCLLGALY
ncbi:hypothetical protein GUJ93_ZPchr0008g13238 [Zizania palustris]|uniref:Uncharacterized protein n=1 Tax=Zizania palustris TaxID=103762 RepID=A0A8J5R9J1_ZIZPA|nr:hypothetical protein GUJ93_ZPchr0008g13238 [Zizania palustris]